VPLAKELQRQLLEGGKPLERTRASPIQVLLSGGS